MTKTSITTINRLREFEGYKPMTYQDGGGVWTGGYGHTGKDVRPNRPVSRAQAEAWLAADIRAVEATLEKYVLRASQMQYDALALLVFNIGASAFRRSTLLRAHNEGDYEKAASEFDRWVYDNGKVVDGLVTRRFKERRIYEAGCPRG